MKTLAIALLLTTGLAAQTVSPDEQTYGPFTTPPDGTSMAVAPTGHGLLLVWSEIDPGTDRARIHTGTLDFDGRLTGEIHVLPPLDATQHAIEPQVTTDFQRFFIAWRERNANDDRGQRVAAMFVNLDGTPAGQPASFGKAVAGAPSLLWDGIIFRLYGDASYRITQEGTVTRIRGSAPQRIPFATPDMNGWVDWVSDEDTRCPYWFGCGARGYSLSWRALTQEWSRGGWLNQSSYTGEAPGVTAVGTNLLIVWSSNRGLAGMRIVDGNQQNPFSLPDDRAERTAAAVSGSLAVFAKDGDVYGSVVGANSFGPIFPISADGEWDTRPRVYAVGYERYLVTYVREHAPGTASLVGRFVTLPQ